jgi:hypothetical protein
MPQEIASVTPSMRSEIITRAKQAAAALASPRPTEQQAAMEGKRLLGSYPHAKPADPQGYALAISVVLQAYPLDVVRQCCDPRTGLARTREFTPTVASIVEWCDRRVRQHEGAVIHGKLEQAKISEERFTPEHRLSMLERLKGLWTSLKAA